MGKSLLARETGEMIIDKVSCKTVSGDMSLAGLYANQIVRS